MITFFLGSDHAGFETKEKVKSFLNSVPEHEIHDLGCESLDRVDYPDYANKVCSKVVKAEEEMKNKKSKVFGVLICGSGQGMAMRANKFKNIRAALCWSEESASLSRNHNNANVICLASRLIEYDEIKKILKSFINTDFEGGRHKERVEKIGFNTII